MLPQYDIKMPSISILLRSPSPQRNIIQHVRRTEFQIFEGAVLRTDLYSSFKFVSAYPQGISWQRRPYFPQVLPLLRSVFDLTLQVFFDVCLTSAFFLAQPSEQTRVFFFLLPAFFAASRRTLCTDSQSCFFTPSNVWDSRLQSESRGRLHLFRSILVVSTKAC